MKLYVIFLSFVLAVIVPINAYAIFPLLAQAGSVAGRVLLPTATSYAIKKLKPEAQKGLVKTAVGWCVKHPTLCSTAFSTGFSLSVQNMGDDITIINDNDTVNIYTGSDTCYYINQFSKTRVFPSVTAIVTALEGYVYKDPQGWTATTTKVRQDGALHITYWVDYSVSSGITDRQGGESVYQIACTPDLQKKFLNDDDIYNKVINNLSDDDFVKIYNYDYSKDGDITINNQKITGDTINNYKNDFDDTYTKNVSEGAKDNIVNKKYDIDDVNEQNCNKNAKGELDKCGDDRDDDSSDSSTSDTDTPDSATANTDIPDDEPPIECEANGFYKKVCDWMDWTQSDYKPDDNTKPDIQDKTKDLPELKQDRVQFSEQCPPPKRFTISAMGITKELEISYQQYCDFFIAFKPFAVPLSTFGAILIIAGVGRKDG